MNVTPAIFWRSTFPLLAGAVLSLGPACPVQAQTNACDMLKEVLAGRIEATGVRGYSLETVPAKTPVPPDAKAIGNCEGGAYKVLYRRWGGSGAQASADAASKPAPAVASAASTPAATVQPKPVPPVAVATAPRAAAPVVSPPPAVAVAASKPATMLPVREAERPAAVTPPVVVAAAAIERRAEPEPATQQKAQVAADAPARSMAEKLPEKTEEKPADKAAETPADSSASTGPTPLARFFDALQTLRWPWLWALVLMPLAGWLWLWYAHHRAYDEAGLPRGPRL